MFDGEQPLSGLTVIDCSTVYAGPLAAMYMGDFGAEVIKVEHPGRGDSLRDYGPSEEETVWKWVGRNKRSVPIDLHDPDGQSVLLELVEDADVFIENFRPGTLEDWNIGWETLSSVNPELVMVRMTGFGQTGPYSDRPGFGTLAEAMSGFAYVTGPADGPPTLPAMPLADAVAAMYATFATMFALYWRDVNGGTGQYIDTSILEPLFGAMGEYTVDYGTRGVVHERSGNRSPHTAPRNTYKTKDDRWVALSGSSQSIAQRILEIVGGEDLREDPRFETAAKRIENVDALDDIIADWMADRTRAEAIRIFEEHDAALAPVYNTADIFEDEHFEARDAVAEVDDEDFGNVPMPAVFPKLSETPGSIDHTGPDLGEDTMAVLTDRTSLSEEEVRELAVDGTVTLEE
ncbi:MAG: CaiB/BaiF CoA transferase family protein [Halodesulfurarchaeum sp.]